jgi:RND family efflux transporter MFP subunit
VSSWDPAVATLPDLNHMESVTYVNEIDVRKVAVGQPAMISLDSDPTKKLTGKVTSVANVGEQRPNADAKVFEVHIEVEHPDTTLRPGMTTGNAIETYAIQNALYVPLEAVITEGGIPFAYKVAGSHVTKQEVETGAINEDEIVITRGLEENDKVLLAPPPNAADLDPVRLPGSTATPTPAVGGDTGAGAKPVPKAPATKAGADPASPGTPKAPATKG